MCGYSRFTIGPLLREGRLREIKTKYKETNGQVNGPIRGQSALSIEMIFQYDKEENVKEHHLEGIGGVTGLDPQPAELVYGFCSKPTTRAQ